MYAFLFFLILSLRARGIFKNRTGWSHILSPGHRNTSSARFGPFSLSQPEQKALAFLFFPFQEGPPSPVFSDFSSRVLDPFSVSFGVELFFPPSEHSTFDLRLILGLSDPAPCSTTTCLFPAILSPFGFSFRLFSPLIEGPSPRDSFSRFFGGFFPYCCVPPPVPSSFLISLAGVPPFLQQVPPPMFSFSGSPSFVPYFLEASPPSSDKIGNFVSAFFPRKSNIFFFPVIPLNRTPLPPFLYGLLSWKRFLPSGNALPIYLIFSRRAFFGCLSTNIARPPSNSLPSSSPKGTLQASPQFLGSPPVLAFSFPLFF